MWHKRPLAVELIGTGDIGVCLIVVDTRTDTPPHFDSELLIVYIDFGEV